jgi:hypothetical protein
MSYGSHGIQQKGRLLEIGEETAGITGERGKSKGKTPEQKERDRLRKIELRKLQKDGEHVRQVKPAPSWFQCSCCMAAIGIGSHSAGKLIGVCNTSVSRQWRDRGVKAEKTSVIGWHMVARKARTAQKEEEEAPSKAYNAAAMQEIRQHRSKAVYPCWSVIWDVEKIRRKSAKAYEEMSPEEKKELYKRQWKGRKNNPHYREKARLAKRKWDKNNPEKARASTRSAIRKRKLVDPGYRAQCNLRNRFKDIMGVVRDPTRGWNSSLIGCDTRQLAAHLEARFKRGMSWENYGTHWHVDHIVPVSKFDHTIPHHVRQCWHYSNLQPLWAADNLAKSDSIDSDTQLSLTL